MITFIINDKPYTCENRMNELTAIRFLQLLSYKQPLDRIAACIGVERSIVDAMDYLDLYDVMSGLIFLKDLEQAELTTTEPFDAGAKKWSEIIAAEQALKRHSGMMTAACEIAVALGGEDVADTYYTNAGIALTAMNCLIDFLREFEELGESEVSDIDMMAGYDKLEALGFFPSLIALCERFGKSTDEVLSMTAREVYMIFLTDKRKNEYLKEREKLQRQINKR